MLTVYAGLHVYSKYVIGVTHTMDPSNLEKGHVGDAGSQG